FTKVSDWTVQADASLTGVASPSPHADHWALVSPPDFDGQTSKRLFDLSDGGVYRTRDVYTAAQTSGWESLNDGLVTSLFYSVAGNAKTGVVIGGTQDNGTLRFAGDPQTWTKMFSGHGGWAAADQTDATRFYGE